MTGVPAGLQSALGGRYVLDRELARGGMAAVYLARDVKHQRDVAVKVLSADISLAIDAERFRREIALIASLRHPHIVPLFDSGDVGGQQYYVMPLITGESLRDRIARERQLAIPDVRRITGDVAAALEYAHRHGVVHRDVKPANVLLEDEHAVVADFGIARRSAVDVTDRLTTTGMFVGTPAYMSPEQVTGAEPLDARTDVYSLGCVVFEMLVGQPPFNAQSPHATVGQHLTSPVPSARAERPDLSPQVDDVRRRALAKSPGVRFSSVREFAEAIESALAATLVEPVEGSTHQPALVRFFVRSRRQLALGIALLLGVVVVGWLGLKRFGTPLAQIQSLAVLPLENLTRDSTQDYFVEGMHDALIGQLAQVSGRRIISRKSAMHYKGSTMSVPDIARELDVDAVVDGSVFRAGDTVRIQLQLIQADPERHIWTQTYERHLRDVLALHNEIAGTVARQIAATLSPSGKPLTTNSTAQTTLNPAAYDEYLRGRYYLAQAPTTLESAIQHFEKALTIDSVFAPARAGLSESFWWFAQTGRPQFFARSRVEARRAIDLDPALPEAHVAEALARMSDWDWTGSEAAFKRAIDLNPSSSQARQWHAQLLRVMLRLDEALLEARRAVQLDPFSLIVRAMEGWVHFSNGRQDEALKVYERVLELEPGFGIAIYNQGLSYWMLRQGDSVIRAAERAASARLPIDSLHRDWLLSIGYALAGRREDARATLDRLEARLVPMLPNTFSAAVYHELGDDGKALDLLERSLALREPDLPLVTSEPGFGALRQNVRFRNVRRAMRLP